MKTDHQIDLCRAFVQSSSFWSEDIPQQKIEGPAITISQSAGARGNPIAAELVRQLRANSAIPRHRLWTLFNQRLVHQVVEEHGLPKSTVGFFPEDRAGHLMDMIGEALGLHPGVYTAVAKTAETVLRLAQSGNAVIVGRGGNFITRRLGMVLHVRLVGTLEVRIRSFAKIYKVSQDEAVKEVARRDRARKNYILENFRQDINDVTNYDLVLNTDDLSDSDAAQILSVALEAKVKQATRQSQNGPRTPTPRR
jgi:hypothetical protein